jgi:hypothetical protein
MAKEGRSSRPRREEGREMRVATTMLRILHERVRRLESRMRRTGHVRFGEGRMEKDEFPLWEIPRQPPTLRHRPGD